MHITSQILIYLNSNAMMKLKKKKTRSAILKTIKEKSTLVIYMQINVYEVIIHKL